MNTSDLSFVRKGHLCVFQAALWCLCLVRVFSFGAPDASDGGGFCWGWGLSCALLGVWWHPWLHPPAVSRLSPPQL